LVNDREGRVAEEPRGDYDPEPGRVFPGGQAKLWAAWAPTFASSIAFSRTRVLGTPEEAPLHYLSDERVLYVSPTTGALERVARPSSRHVSSRNSARLLARV